MVGWPSLSLSRRQIGDADRVGGIELILPWPGGLPIDQPLAEDDERDTSPAEHAVAEALLREACETHGLVPVRSAAAMLRRPSGLPRAGAVEQHLCVVLIGWRWVHATGARAPREAWATIPTVRRAGCGQRWTGTGRRR